MARKKKSSQPDHIAQLESLKQINMNAAGLDIGSAEIWACVPEGRSDHSVRVFDTFSVELHALADWLEQCGIETVAMESTGIYWLPVYEILVNAHVIKSVSGRKSDLVDCQWIQQLHTYGLLPASFRPDAEIATLRAYVRHRENLLRYRAAHIQHMQKSLQLMNVQLPNIISDITGVTGMKIIRSILAGERNPLILAHFRDPRCNSTEEEIAKYLEGNYRPEHLFALRQAVELFDFYNQQLAACDVEMEALYANFHSQVETPPPPSSKRKRRRRKANYPRFDLRSHLYRICGVDLTEVDGIDVLIAQDVLAEIGLDMHKWPTVKHFASWLRLCPNNDISGGKVLRRSTKKTNNRANNAFRMAAQAVGRSDSALGAFYRRIKYRHGAPKAVTATAHKIARIVYVMLKDRKPYQDLGSVYYEEQYRKRMLRNLQRKASKFGLCLVPVST
jgi:transposase